jgi:hypothetical protein
MSSRRPKKKSDEILATLRIVALGDLQDTPAIEMTEHADVILPVPCGLLPPTPPSSSEHAADLLSPIFCFD